MTGDPEAVENVVPVAGTAFEQEVRQAKQTVEIVGGTLRADGAAAPWTYITEVLAAPGGGALRQVEPEPELGQDQELVAYQRRDPVARGRCRLDRREQALERLVNTRITLPLRQSGRGQGAEPVDRRGGQGL